MEQDTIRRNSAETDKQEIPVKKNERRRGIMDEEMYWRKEETNRGNRGTKDIMDGDEVVIRRQEMVEKLRKKRIELRRKQQY